MRMLAITLSLLTALSFTAPEADAAGPKIAVVKVEYVVMNSKKGKAAKKKLKRIFDKRQKELDKRQNELLEIKKQLENPSAMMTQEIFQKKAAEYKTGLMKLQEEFVKNQQELAKQENKLMQPLLESLDKVLVQQAKAGGYDLVLNWNQHGVLFAKPSHDITQAVLKALDKQK
ncbi:MAG: OmpH family outer membrane protein [Myxococcota bacterium]